MHASANADDPRTTVHVVATRPNRDTSRDTRIQRLLEDLRDNRFHGKQAEMARAIGVTPTTVSDMLSGKRGAGIDVLVLLADYLGISLDELVRGVPFRPDLLVVRNDRYPARAKAREQAREIFERADRAIAGHVYARAEDKPVEWWMRRIEEAQIEVRRELEDPEGTAKARDDVRARTAQTAMDDEASLAAAERDDASLSKRPRR